MTAPARTVFLHIGIHKTGSSAIQNVCIANRARLLQAGFLFPKAGFTIKRALNATATSGHSGLIDFLSSLNTAEPAGPGRALLSEIRSGSWNRLVISSEVLSAPHNAAAVECISWFREQGLDVKLIAYLRRQDRWLDSFYRERLRWDGPQYRDTRSIDEFWRDEGDDWLNYKKRIGTWVAAAGREHTHIRSYEDVQSGKGVVGDFLEIIGAEPDQLDLTQGDDLHNPSIPPAAADFVRAANTIPCSVIPRKGPLVSAILQTSLFTRPGGTVISPALWEEIKTAYQDQNEELRAHWMTGPSMSFSFRDGPGPKPMVAQSISFADAGHLLDGMARVVGEPPLLPGAGSPRRIG